MATHPVTEKGLVFDSYIDEGNAIVKSVWRKSGKQLSDVYKKLNNDSILFQILKNHFISKDYKHLQICIVLRYTGKISH